MSYKKYLFLAFVIPLPFLLAYIILLYVYDPLQIYHKPYFRETTFSTDMRRQALGIIKHYDFDSYIIGTSMLENTSAKEASEKLGGKWVNISLADSSFNERAVILDYLFKHKNPKKIIYSIDMENYFKEKSTAHYDFLYNANRVDDIRIYFSIRYGSCLIKNTLECGQKVDLENLQKWSFKNKRVLENFGGFEKLPKVEIKRWLESVNQQAVAQTDISEFQESFNHFILSFIKQNPNSQFELIIPPYSILQYVSVKDDFMHSQFALALKWLLQAIKNYTNARVYGFDNLSYTDDIANYRDFTHYNTDMNSLQLDAIKNKSHILTLENIDMYLNTMQQKIQNYDITPLIDIAKNTLEY